MTVMLTATLPSQATIPTLDVFRTKKFEVANGSEHIRNESYNESSNQFKSAIKNLLALKVNFHLLEGEVYEVYRKQTTREKKHIDSTIIPVKKNKFLTSKKGSLSSPYPCVTLKLRHIKLAHWALRSPLRHRKADRQEENVTSKAIGELLGHEGFSPNWHLSNIAKWQKQIMSSETQLSTPKIKTYQKK